MIAALCVLAGGIAGFGLGRVPGRRAARPGGPVPGASPDHLGAQPSPVGPAGADAALDPPVPGAGPAFASTALDGLIRACRSCVMIAGPDGNVVRASPPAAVMGLLRDDGLVHEQLRPIVRQTRRNGITHEIELSLTRERFEHARIAASVRAAPLGRGYVVLFVDDRTRAQRVEDVRRDFVANVSHELKTPVGGISLLAEAVLDASDDPQTVSRFAGRILLESNRLASLVQDIVDLSRIQASESITDPARVSLPAVVREAIDSVATLSESRGITIVTELDERAFVLGDEQMLVIAVGNLLSNAINYSADHTRVAVTVRRRDGVAEVAVADQGQGMAPEDLERIFERFYRVDRARSRATGGTGLGLAIVKHVCSNHGGEVKVWSVLGEGSTFTMRLPVPPPLEERAGGAGGVPAGEAPWEGGENDLAAAGRDDEGKDTA